MISQLLTWNRINDLTVELEPLSTYQMELHQKIADYYEELLSKGVAPLPPLRRVPFKKLKAITKEVDAVLQRLQFNSLQHLIEIIYCTAKTVTDECGMLRSNSNCNHLQPPCWQVRLQNKLRVLHKDLSWLTELENHRLLSATTLQKL